LSIRASAFLTRFLMMPAGAFDASSITHVCILDGLFSVETNAIATAERVFATNRSNPNVEVPWVLLLR
jgi:hypothetical protein